MRLRCERRHPAFPEKPFLLADIGRLGRPIRLAADARGRRQSGRFARLAVRAATIWAKRFFGGEGRQDHLCRYTAAASRPQPLGGGSRRWLAADSGRSASRASPWRVGAWVRPAGSHLASDFARHPPPLRLHRRFTSLTPALPGWTKTMLPKEAILRSIAAARPEVSPYPGRLAGNQGVAKRHRLVLNGNGGGEEEKRRRKRRNGTCRMRGEARCEAASVGPQIARSAPAGGAPSGHRAADDEPKPCGLDPGGLTF